MTAPTRPRQDSLTSRAWLAVVVNLVAFPGLGTIMAKRWTGYIQAGLTLAGFAVFMGYMLWYFAEMIRVASDISADMDAFRALARQRLWIVLGGLAIVAVAWVWSLFSSLAILREARARQAPPPLP